MKKNLRQLASPALAKAAAGIAGFDDITDGGLPRGRCTVLAGGPGSGKTIFALQFLVHGAQGTQATAEPGIFVAFEESAERVQLNAGSFGWDLAGLSPKRLLFIDARPPPEQLQAGDFDLGGLLAGLTAQLRVTKARRIVFDALDIVLAMLPDLAAQRREIHRLHEWLLAQQLTAIITAKSVGDEAANGSAPLLSLMQFMVDCTVLLQHRVALGVSQRNLRVQKYRGSGFDENEAPFLISRHGFEVPLARVRGLVPSAPSSERLSSGVARLDTMLGGGYFRGASVLVTGFSGTAKTTLAGAFAEAACLRGDRTLFVSFDADCSEVRRNLASGGLRVRRFARSGRLQMASARSITGSAETYLARLKLLATEHRSRCLVIDPVSTWAKSGEDLTAHSVADRLMDWAKGEGITLLCTSLLDEMSSRPEDGSPLQISTLADTWIHLSYLVQAGERNRGLSIIKSRGTAHSNQVRELILSSTGVTLADTYSADGAVLMGTMRWEKESSERLADEMAELAEELRRARLATEQAALTQRARALDLEQTLLAGQAASRLRVLERRRERLDQLRGADVQTVKP